MSERRLEDATLRGKIGRPRALGLLSVLAVAIASFSLAAAPASARPRDSIWLTTSNGLKATTNVVPPSSYIAIYEYRDGAVYDVRRICQMAMTCSTPLTLSPGNHITSFVAYIVTSSPDPNGPLESVFATSNTLSFAM